MIITYLLIAYFCADLKWIWTKWGRIERLSGEGERERRTDDPGPRCSLFCCFGRRGQGDCI